MPISMLQCLNNSQKYSFKLKTSETKLKKIKNEFKIKYI